MQAIYAESARVGWKNAFDQVTNNWDVMEKLDFKSWMQFYQESAHQKYKTAQFAPKYIDNGPGSFIPLDAVRSTLPRSPDMGAFNEQQSLDAARTKEQEEAQRKELVTLRLRSLISRLNAADKLATIPEVQKELNKVLPNGVQQWLAALQELKREIQLMPIRVSSVSLVEDLIYKNANRLVDAGNKPAALVFLKLAQMGMASTPAATNPMGVTPMNPIDTTMGGQPMGMGDGPAPSLGGGPLGVPPVGAIDSGADPVKDKTMQDFVKSLSEPDDNDVSESDDDLVVEDGEELTATAQAAPMQPSGQPSKQTPEELQVTENDLAPQEPLPADVADPSGAELVPDNPQVIQQDPFDMALANVKVSDIIARLESVASMFKNRKIARELSVIDLMMDKMGIATFFPTLGEAMRSALESNQYCQSRVEEVLAKLRGSVDTPMSQQMETDITGDTPEQAQTPADEALKGNLAKEEAETRARKERRKQQAQAEEDAAAQTAAQPVNTEAQPNTNELAGPAQVETAPPVRPTAPAV